MVKLHIAGAAFLLFSSAATAQPNASLDRWVTVGSDATHPIASGRHFDLAFGVDHRPVLAFIDDSLSSLDLKKWDGRAWTGLPGLNFQGEHPQHVRTAYNWAGDIVVGLSSNESIQVYQLSGSQLNRLGGRFPVQQASGFDVAIDARGPVVAWMAGGFVVVKRWDGANWVQLGQNDESPATFSEEQSPSLAVTGDGKLVVAYTVGPEVRIIAKVWNGTRWTALGDGVPPPSRSLSSSGENSGAPVVAYLDGSFPQVSRWTGSTWAAIGRPCAPPPPPPRARNFGVPSLTVPGNQPQVVCGIHTNSDVITGRRMLVARAWSRPLGWGSLGRDSINGEIVLADDSNLAYIVRSGPQGRPWVAWTAQGEGNSNVFVSTLEPNDNPTEP